MTEPALSVRDLHVWFEVPSGEELHAVQGVTFDVLQGERFGLVGESGCGKSTTILTMMGLLPSNARFSGEVAFEGREMLNRGEEYIRGHRWKDIAIVFQGAMNAFNPVLSVGEQIVEAMEVHHVARGAEARRRAREMLQLVGIAPERANQYPHEFSGGMRQRAAIAMALACEPRILLADEPTTALDVMVQAQLLRLLEKLSDELGLTLILVTHDLPVVAETCSRAGVMYAGRIVEIAPVDKLYHDPRHPYTRMLFAATPDLHDRARVTSIPGAPPRLDRPLLGCPFHPRCDRAFDPCAAIAPQLISVHPGHAAACHLNDPRWNQTHE